MKVLLGMSGGVDSSVAAYLLKKSGYDVVGLHFTITDKKADLKDLDSVCKKLDIPYHVVDFSQIFSQFVFDPFIKEYQSGKTPNICVACNKFIKFGALLDMADKLGCDLIATGHYCKVKIDGDKVYLLKAKDQSKDQTYFLNNVPKESLKRTLFPLADYTKEQIREIAKQMDIPTAEKKDSSDVCLAEGRKFSDFINEHITATPGPIITTNGERVGTHKGLHLYTLGQRKGLDLGGKSGEDGRWFVVGKDGKTNTLYVSHGNQDLLHINTFYVNELNFILEPPENVFTCTVKTRYRTTEKDCTVSIEKGVATVTLLESERAVTEGQYAVFYSGDYCLGGGKIMGVKKG